MKRENYLKVNLDRNTLVLDQFTSYRQCGFLQEKYLKPQIFFRIHATDFLCLWEISFLESLNKNPF